MSPVATLALALASGLAITSALLMLRGSLRARSSDGLATGMLALNLFIHPMWLTYAIQHGNPAQAAAGVAWVSAITCWWGFRATDRGGRFWWAVAGMAVWLAVVLASSAFVPYQVYGWIGGTAGVVSFVPQVRALFRADHLGVGFDLRAWSVVLVSMSAWLSYGLAARELPIIVPNIVSLTMVVLIVGRARVLSRRPMPVRDELATAA
ncbi:MAG: hypothetical protein R2737_12415 [Candidatus Nanopelagicales bacterium]